MSYWESKCYELLRKFPSNSAEIETREKPKEQLKQETTFLFDLAYDYEDAVLLTPLLKFDVMELYREWLNSKREVFKEGDTVKAFIRFQGVTPRVLTGTVRSLYTNAAKVEFDDKEIFNKFRGVLVISLKDLLLV